MFVGEAPGHDEDLLGEPFVGREGIHFHNLLVCAGINRDECYFTYAIKCLLKKDDEATELCIQLCKAWLWEEIQLVSPKVIVTLGKIPTQLLLKLKKSATMKSVAGKFHRVEYTQTLIAPWHSSFVLLQGGKSADAEAIQFFKQVKEKWHEVAT